MSPLSPASVLNRRVLICIFTGFASGMPLYLLIQLIPAWLRSSEISLVDIGLFSLVGLPYAWKFVWAPFLDRWALPLGLRRGWMLLTQVLLIACIGALGYIDPRHDMAWVVALAGAIALFSATQDIAIDAYRRELLPDSELGLGNSVHVQAYRIAGLVPGSLSLILADQMSWVSVFWITAGFMTIGIALTLSISEPQRAPPRQLGFKATITEPFQEYIARRGGGRDLGLILLFMVVYKLGDNMATALAMPFYLDLGFSMTEIGWVAKHAALWPSIFGGLLGGLWMIKLGINRSLWIFGAIQMISIPGFAILAMAGPQLWLLATVIAFEYLGVGLGTAALTAFIARESSKTFAATQFALFTALTALPRSLANASTGWMVEALGWVLFFMLCATLALPGLIMLRWIAPWHQVSTVGAEHD
ncbi:MAG: AmpG family muropeptide MFS transporter [Luminiphilus sp.]|nr:AmpG family muropeptide MFS transporter [Luminiphilus sp.]